MKLFDFLHFSRRMMPGAVTVQDSDVITTGPTHSIGGAGARQGWGVEGRGAQQAT